MVGARVLVVEDLLATTVGTIGTLRAWGNEVVVAKSLQAATSLLEAGEFDCACVDQLVPTEEGGDGDATDEQLFAFAVAVGRTMPFIWLTAHEVPAARMAIAGCIGVVEKSGEVTESVAAKLSRHVPSFTAVGLGAELEPFTIELEEKDAGTYLGLIRSWRSEKFVIRAVLLPGWVQELVRSEGPRPVALRAQGWLGADRPGQLDLSGFDQLAAEE